MQRVLWTLLLAVPIGAMSADEVLNLDQLIQEAIQNNPELHAAQKRVEAFRQKPRQEGSLPDPIVSLGYTAVGGPLPGYGLGTEPTAAIGFLVTQDLPYPGKRELRASMAAKEADVEFQAYSETERAIIARLKLAFHKLNHAYEALDAIRYSQSVLADFIEISEARYSAGKAKQEEIFRAQSELAVMEVDAVRMQRDIETATADMNAVLHRPVDAPFGRPSHPAPKAIVMTLPELMEGAVKSSPQLIRDQRKAEASQMGIALAERNYKPDFAVSGGYYNMGSMPPMFQGRLDIKIPARRAKNDAALTEKVNSLAEARYNYAATETEVRWRVKERYTAAQTSWRLLQLYRDSVMPQTELATASALSSYEAGTADSAPVLMSLISRVQQEERYHEEMLNYFTAVIQLEEITGKDLL